MAITIQNPPTGILFTSGLGTVTIATDGLASVYVRVVRTVSASTDIELYAETLYAHAGAVTLAHVGALIEADMRSNNIAFGPYAVKVSASASSPDTPVSATFSALYCDRFLPDTSAETYCAQNYLATLHERRLAPGQTFYVSVLLQSGESKEITANAYFRLRDDEAKTVRRWDAVYNAGQTASALSVATHLFQLDPIVGVISAGIGQPEENIELVKLTINMGDRSMAAVVDASLDPRADSFVFRNCFNVLDVATMPSLETLKVETERSLATVDDRISVYDRKQTETRICEFGPLTHGEAVWLGELANAASAWRMYTNDDAGTEWVPVVFLEGDFEVSDTDDDPPSVKLTWRYASERPRLKFERRSDIFTQEFNPAFS